MKKLLVLLPAMFVLSACGGGGGGGGDDIDAKDLAVIAGRAPDFSSGAISLVDVDAPHAAQNSLNPASSDLVVRSGGDHYFVIERFGHDTVTRYEGKTPGTKTWTYSTQDPTNPTQDSNPIDLIIVSANKAYLLRYGAGKVWIVNPSAATEAAFKIGEIDLSAYDADGVPEMTAGIVRDGKLYVAMQRLVNFQATQDAYVAVIDVASNAEVATGAPGAALKGVSVPMRNPDRLEATPDGHIILEGGGGFGGAPDFAPNYDGGIVSIDPSTYAVTTIVADGDAATHPFGQFTDVAVVGNHRGYFLGGIAFGPTTLYRFDPAGGSAPVAVTGLPETLGPLAVSPNGQLFVGLGSSSAPGVAILNVTDSGESIETARVDTVLNPINIDFMTVEE